MIIQFNLTPKLIDLRKLNMKDFDNKIEKAIKEVYPSLIFKPPRKNGSKIVVQGVPIMYVNSIKNTLEYIFTNFSFNEKHNDLTSNESLIDLMFKSFSLGKKDREGFLNEILNIKIEYKEDLFFYSKTPIKNRNRLKMLYQNDNRYFYKINYNSKLHSDSSLKIFNNIIEADSNSKNISIINNPSTLFKFQFTLDKDLNMLRKLIKIYRRSDINKLPEEDIIQYDKYFKYITFLTNNKKNKKLEDKKNIHKQIQLNKNEMYKHILPK